MSSSILTNPSAIAALKSLHLTQQSLASVRKEGSTGLKVSSADNASAYAKSVQGTDALTNGVSSLINADLNEASSRLQALQTQQQLGVQSLSIANQNSQMILKLFQ